MYLVLHYPVNSLMESMLVLLFFPIVLASRDEPNRNVLRFSRSRGWQGPPAALVEIDGVLHLYYEQPIEPGKMTGSGTQTQLGHTKMELLGKMRNPF